jgi:long-chain acyl-CoA synthetase
LYITGRFKEEYKLANGKYIHPDTIELEMKVLPWVLNAVIVGAGHDYNVGLIVPDMKLLKNIAMELNLSVEPKDLFDPASGEGKKLKELLTAEISNHLKKTIGSYEIPRKFAFILDDFTLDNGMLTQTMKLKRQVVMQKYGDMLEKLYQE